MICRKAFMATGDGILERGNCKQCPPLNLIIGSDPWWLGLHDRHQQSPRDGGTGELHQPMVSLLFLADGHGFNEREESHQAATSYKELP